MSERTGEYRECAQCGAQFYRSSFEMTYRPALYCSRPCADKGKTRSAIRECIGGCGTLLTIYPSRKTPGVWCTACYTTKGVSARFKGVPKSEEQKRKLSENRANRPRLDTHPAWKGGAVTKTCEQCGEDFTRKRDITRNAVTRFCGTECWYEWIRDDPSRSSAWRGGHVPNYGTNWNRQARAARARDGYRCQRCGSPQKGRTLEVHHIRKLTSFERWQDANVLSNLVTLCKPCHGKAKSERDPNFYFRLSFDHAG